MTTRTTAIRLTPETRRLYQDLSKRPLANVMQRITVQVDILSIYPKTTRLAILQSTTSLLHLFSGPTIPRAHCAITILFAKDANPLLEASFLKALGELTGFKTVALKLACLRNGRVDLRKKQLATYKSIDEYLTVMLGPGEAGNLDEDGAYHRLTYHPRGRPAYQKATPV